MYKYQCSKSECGSIWMLEAGNISGFNVTCPSCGKGRGIFLEHIRNNQSIEKDLQITKNKFAVEG